MNWKKKLATYTSLAALATLIIHIINKLVYFMATIENLLGKKEGLYYDWKFGKIFYTKNGSGKPILLIHDLDACSSEYEWNKIISTLSKTNTVYTLDLLGCGKSDKPHFTYTNFLYVQLITDFIKNVISEKTDVIVTGNSSSFVLMACHNDHTIIDKILLINPPSISLISKVPTKRTKLLKLLINIPFIGTLLFNILHNKQSIEETFMTEYFYNPQFVTEDMIKTYYESSQVSKTQSKFLFASIKGKYTTANVIECLTHTDNSIFILVGNGNPVYREYAIQYQTYTPSIEIQTIEKAKYLPQLEVPEKILEQIKILFEL